MKSLRSIFHAGRKALAAWFLSVPPVISLGYFRFYLVGHAAYNFALTVHTIWLILFSVLGVWPLVLFNGFSVVLFLACIIMNRRGRHMLPTILGMTEVVAHQVFACWMLGVRSGYQLYILVVSLYPFIMPAWRPWIKATLFLGSLGGFLFIELALGPRPPLVALDPIMLDTLRVTNMVFSFLCLGIWGIYFSMGMRRTEEKLDHELQRSDELLLNILPGSVAERLKAGERIIGDRFSMTSILFADLVGFTQFAERLEPDRLVMILNEHFTKFDSLADRFGLEKIKTIGDAYMVAAGVPEERADHAEAIGHFALAMLEALEDLNRASGRTLQLRIGIHCGTVAAGVIGARKFTYDLWGDTVNVASRMESSGVPAKIHCTTAFAQACGDHFLFEARSPIEVKGKGRMDTCFLIRRAFDHGRDVAERPL